VPQLKDIELIRFLLDQQFYYGNDFIIGRNKDISCFIEGSGATIERFYGNLIENIEDIRSGQYNEYLEKFYITVYPIDTKFIFDKINVKFNLLEREQLTPEIIASILIGELLMYIKKICFEDALIELKVILIELIQKHNKNQIDPENRIELTEEYIESKMKRLKKLFSLNNGEIGMIYNLAFLQSIALKVDLEVYKNTKIALKTYMEKVGESLLKIK
jgi:hypothetical protein